MSTITETPTLAVELVPSPVWGSNLRTLAPKAWPRLRQLTRERSDGCAYCDGPAAQCHEGWAYDEHDERFGTQRLTALLMVCEDCHRVVHLGRTGKVEGAKGISKAKAHLAAVNGWTADEVERHVADAQSTWTRRSAMGWGLDLTAAEGYGLTRDDLDDLPFVVDATVRHEVTGAGLPAAMAR